VARAAARTKAEIIVETQMHGVPSGARAARVAGLPLVLDDSSPPEEEVVLQTVLPGLIRRMFNGESSAAAELTVSSNALVRCLSSAGVAEGKLRVVPNGVAVRDFRSEDRESTRRKLGLNGCIVAGFVGSFQPWHRVDLLLQAVAVGGHLASLHLLLVGDGSERAVAEELAVRLEISDRVTFTGSQPAWQIPEFLAACDIGVLPGSNEYGQPMKLVEYAASGLASVAPNLPPVREVLEDDRTGLLFSPGDATGLSRALERLLADPRLRARLGQAAGKSARDHDWSRSAVRMEEVLASILRRGGGG
jgi:glycosyltransferase involved in cell wall biosynthesis